MRVIARKYTARNWQRKGTAMFTLPYRTLIHQKRWATNGLHTVIAGTFGRLPADEQALVLRLLDHIQVVDEIFCCNLEARPHAMRRRARPSSRPSTRWR